MVDQERTNILIITLSNIGDVILTTPVIAFLRSTFLGARITVVVGPKAADLLRESPQINRLLIYDKWAGWSHKLELVRSLREEFYDWVIDLRNSLFPFLVRAERRSPIFRFFHSKNARERHLEVLEETLRRARVRRHSREAPSLAFDFFSKAEEISLLEKLRRKEIDPSTPWIVVAPGAGSEAKRWPLAGFREVVRRLLEISSFNVVAVGDEREVSLGRELAEVHPKRVINLAGEISLRELAALVSSAKLVLTNDSTVMHLGYELYRPVVALFGPTEHEKYGRENKIWRIVREVPPSNFEHLSPPQVISACEELLNGVHSLAS